MTPHALLLRDPQGCRHAAEDRFNRIRAERPAHLLLAAFHAPALLACLRLCDKAKKAGTGRVTLIHNGGLDLSTGRLAQALKLSGVDDTVRIDETDEAAWTLRLLTEFPAFLPQDYSSSGLRPLTGSRTPLSETILRITYRCNERCVFCWIEDDQPPVPTELIRRSISQAYGQGARILTFSGGEPTLHPDLATLAGYARELGFKGITCQTNGLLLDEARRVQPLLDAGINEFCLALHGDSPEVLERITGVARSLPRKLAALRLLLEADISLIVNHVICQANVERLERFAQMMVEHGTAPRARVTVNFSLASPMGRISGAAFAPLAARLDDVRRHIGPALSRLRAAGIPVMGFGTDCGLPLCVFTPGPEPYGPILPSDATVCRDDFVKPPVCAGCAYGSSCYGIRRLYLEYFGQGELRPFRERV